MRRQLPDSFLKIIRYALLAFIFCAVCAVELVHAMFAMLTLSELHAYWLGREGHFPFSVLPWSERHFGGDTLALRLPLIAVLVLMLVFVLLGLNRLIRRQRPIVLICGSLVLLAAMAAQQYFSLKALRRERREFATLMNRVERAASPGEAVVADWNMVLPLYAYGSSSLRHSLEGEASGTAGVPPVGKFDAESQQGEFIFVGSLSESFAKQLAVGGYQFHEDQTGAAGDMDIAARYYRAKGTRIYFVSPPARRTADPVSSKP